VSAFGIRILATSENEIHKNAELSSFWKHQKKEHHEAKDTNTKF
jgi:hypothetical protein